MRILSKFGGSSLASAKQFLQVKKIISSNKNRQIIVVSAPEIGRASCRERV